MSECCPPSVPCCGGGGGYSDTFEYGPQPFELGEAFTIAGPVPVVATALAREDRAEARRVRLNVGRDRSRVRPGLYAVGAPDDTSPVLVTGNYRLSFDAVRSAIPGLDAWILVVDSRGVNVWCAAGKGVFSTAEVVRSIRAVHLEQVVGHQRVILPQLAATGVAGHEVRAQTGFGVTWGPVRAADLPAFLSGGMKASPEMRRVRFPLAERAKLIGVELSVLWRPRTLAGVAALIAVVAALDWLAPAIATPLALAGIVAVLSVVVGSAVVPLLLPWIPGRMFSVKGAIAGAVLIGLALAAATSGRFPLYAWGLLAAGSALSAFVAMNFTGSSTFTSPSGVEWEMRRAIPAQVAAAVMGVALFVFGLWIAR